MPASQNFRGRNTRRQSPGQTMAAAARKGVDEAPMETLRRGSIGDQQQNQGRRRARSGSRESPRGGGCAAEGRRPKEAELGAASRVKVSIFVASLLG